MFSWIGFNRKLATNPVTWGVIALITMVSAVAARNDRNLTESCAAMSPVVVGATGIPEYYVGRYENIVFDLYTGRIPDRYLNSWPLSDCRPGGRAHWSDSSLAALAQVCRTKRGNESVL
jgi:hypothetical protein